MSIIVKQPQNRRYSTNLDATEAMKLFDAHRLAHVLGTPLTIHLTLHWQQTSHRSHQAARAELTRVMKRLRDWCDHRGFPFRFLWVFENQETTAKGLHTHIILYVPAELQSEFISFSDGNGFLPSASNFAACRATRPSKANAQDHSTSAARVKYLLKGIDPNTSETLLYLMDDLAAREDGQGRIYGRRYGISRALNTAAQQATLDFTPLLTPFTASIAAKGV